MVVLTGCSPLVESVVTPTKVEPTIQPTAIYVVNNESQVTSVSDSFYEASIVDTDWVTPAQVDIGNFRAGARAEFNLRVHNGSNKVSFYDVRYMVPTDTKDGYSMPPSNAILWVTVPDVVVIQPKETKEVMIVIEIPKDTKIDNDWEFWTSVLKQGQGTVQSQVATRWLINMR